MTGIFALLFVLINLLLHFAIIRPVVKMADFANEVSLGKTNIPYYHREGKDEIASLSTSFNRMRRSLETALKMLDEGK
jgi:protein-histidine pros-kinase